MLFKLALKNIRKSIKDYSIYFFTLVFAVAMFYMFNSIDAQSSMLVLNDSKYEIIEALVVIISYVSIFVSVILGFLIVYSNNFLIRKRKKEIGMYEILGMSKRKVSLILFLETIIVGVVSLIVGLLIGIFLSQFLSIFVSKLFEVNMSSFKFVFSKIAFSKTIIYFGIIFLLVIIFNVITLTRYKLIDLINADKKIEQIKVRNKYITIVTFLLSLVFIGYAYYLLIEKNTLVMMDNGLIIMLATGALGTFLLFYSLSGFLLKVFGRLKRIYYKDLNLFTLKQVNSKINTSVVSTTVICLMLLLTIGMLSGSMSLAKIFNDGLRENNLTDYTIRILNSYSYNKEDITAVSERSADFKKFEEIVNKPNFNKYIKNHTLFHKYVDSKIITSSLMKEEDIEKLKKEYGNTLSFDYYVLIIKESEYKQFTKMVGLDYIDISSDEYIILANVELVNDSYKAHYEEKIPITINNKKLIPGSDHIINMAYENNNTDGNDGVIVVSDEVVKGLNLYSMSLAGNFVSNDNEEKIGNEFHKWLINNAKVGFDYRTRIEMETSSLGLRTMVIFLGLYLGITFAISSATVLAIGQLSESSDNKKRYKVLGQIGADEKMINKALFIQIAITFMFPLVIALIHSYFGLKQINKLLVSLGNVDLTANILFTTIFMVVVYGGYFILTYWCSKNIIKAK